MERGEPIMIECPNCHTPNEDERAGQACINCGEPLPTVGAADNPFDKFHSLVEPPQPQGSKPDTDKEVRYERPRERERKTTFPDDEEEEHLDPNHLDAITEYGKTPIVSVIGFGDSGKSFFVNRLRKELPWKCSRHPAKKIGRNPEGIELTRFVPRDVRMRGGRNHGYVVVDCAGESFVQALESQFTSGKLGGVLARSYLTAMAFASAYILVIRAEDFLPLSRAQRDHLPAEARVQREFIEDKIVAGFDEFINTVVVSQERLRSESPETLLRKGLSRPELENAFKRNHNPCRQPLCVVFSQADRLEKVHGQDDSYDADPFVYALRRASTLVNAVHSNFHYYRFDYLSAFYGHDADARGDDRVRPDYDLPSYGAKEAFLWLHNLLTPRPWLFRPSRIARGEVPTRHLVTLRRKMDSAFDQEWRKAWKM